MKPTLAVGWDVGGWCGKKQAVAVAEWREGTPVFVKPGTALLHSKRRADSSGDLPSLHWQGRAESNEQKTSFSRWTSIRPASKRVLKADGS